MSITYISTKNETELGKFASMYQSGLVPGSRAIRKLVIADSRYSYGGYGANANPLEAFKLWQTYGNCPETPLVQLISWGSAARDDGAGMWCIASNNNLTSHTTGTIRNSGTVPYMMEGNEPYLKNWDGVNATALFTCQHLANSIKPSTGVIPASSFIQTSGLKAEIFLARETTNAPDIKYLLGYDTSIAPAYYPATTISNLVVNTTGVTSVQGDILSMSGVEGSIRSYLTTATGTIPSTGYIHCILGSNSVSGSVEHVGVLFRSTNKVGMGLSSWSAGGKKMGDLLVDRPNCYPTINAYAPDLISFRFAYNDANAGHSASTYQSDAQSLVDWVKNNVKSRDGVNPPLIEFETGYNQSAVSTGNYDNYVAALNNVAAINNGVMILDIRSATDASGFNTAVDLDDGIHANITGCIKVANIRNSLINSLLSYVATVNSLTVQYFDRAESSNFYALIFNSGNLAFNTNTSDFSSYTDATISNFNIGLILNSNRNNYYSSGIGNTANFAKGKYLLEVWQRVGSTPNKSNDYLKGISTLSWDGIQENSNVGVPRLSEPSFIGQRTVTATGDLINFYVESFDNFGSLSDVYNFPTYKFYKNGAALSPDITGVMTKINTGFYNTSRILSSGTLTAPNNYEININATMNGVNLSTTKTLTMVSPIVVNPPDILTSLQYSSGFIKDNTPVASSFITNLNSNVDNYHNGSIFRINGQGRIIYDYDGSTKRISLNKALSVTPVSGDYFIIYPIGGELQIP